jgi:hypothetical protein
VSHLLPPYLLKFKFNLINNFAYHGEKENWKRASQLTSKTVKKPHTSVTVEKAHIIHATGLTEATLGALCNHKSGF